MMDFNDISGSTTQNPDIERDALRADLICRLEGVLFALYPAGKVRKGKFLIGDVLGSPGDSLEVVLDGDKSGLWTDRATGDGGDIFDLIARHHQIDTKADFPKVMKLAQDLTGRTTVTPPKKHKKEALIDELGPATAKWDYFTAEGQLIGCVYRYDPPGQRKEFRPWDAKRKKMAPPDPRPLYNQMGMATSDTVVLVEGEKCAQSLIGAGIVATTAMHGAHAPIEKTDWSPLAGKHVLIWPDRDKAGWDYAMAAADAALMAGAVSCAVLMPPEDKPEGWDVADALTEGMDANSFLATGPRITVHPAAQDESETHGENAVWATDDALALSFTRRYAEDWRYCAPWGKWMVWTGNRWQADDTLLVTHLMRHICREAAIKADSHRLAAKLASSSTVSGVERLARSDRNHASTSDEWDRDPWMANAPGGVINLRTGQVRSHDRADRMTKIMTATPKGNSLRWLAFLSDITGGDRDLMAYLQRVIGYCLTGVTSEHALFFLYGTGANGKSVFINVITTILGDYAANAPMDTFMETRSDRHPTDLAGLRGARFVSSIETEQGRRWNESKVKAITGGDKVSARFMRQDFFEYLPQFKLVIAGNHKPSIRNVDEAMKRRLHLIPFTVTIPPEKRDGKLTEKLLQEREGILAWAVDGCLLWQQHGLKPPKVVVEATEEYFEDEDSIGEFIDEECYVSAVARESISAIYQRWRERAEKRGEYVGTSRWLVAQLLTRGYEKARLSGGIKALAGLSLKPRETGGYQAYRDD